MTAIYSNICDQDWATTNVTSEICGRDLGTTSADSAQWRYGREYARATYEICGRDWGTTATSYKISNEDYSITDSVYSPYANEWRGTAGDTYVTGYNWGTNINWASFAELGSFRGFSATGDQAGPDFHSKKMQLAWKLKSNLSIVVKSRAPEVDRFEPAERVAMETLREFISEAEFRKYLRYGFILVKGLSGDTYQVFRNRAHTRVWRNGKVVEEVCVRIKHDQKVPPTDNVIAFRQIIRSSEDEFKKLGNVYKMVA
ncbi:MAG: hypothetical protein IMZ64_12385 [Bacteroidetes bacterium]|nr:hypothetical protein [Bacteroidota bacterium]